MPNQRLRPAKTPKHPRRRLDLDNFRNRTSPFLIRRQTLDVDILHDDIRARAVAAEPGMVDFGNMDARVRGSFELRVRFGHCGVVVFDEELGAVGCVFQAVAVEAVLPAELLDEGFWGELGMAELRSSVSVTIMVLMLL
jgi:hypothetical protein